MVEPAERAAFFPVHDDTAIRAKTGTTILTKRTSANVPGYSRSHWHDVVLGADEIV